MASAQGRRHRSGPEHHERHLWWRITRFVQVPFQGGRYVHQRLHIHGRDHTGAPGHGPRTGHLRPGHALLPAQRLQPHLRGDRHAWLGRYARPLPPIQDVPLRAEGSQVLYGWRGAGRAEQAELTGQRIPGGVGLHQADRDQQGARVHHVQRVHPGSSHGVAGAVHRLPAVGEGV